MILPSWTVGSYMNLKKHTIFIFISLIIILPFSVFGLYKPVRVIIPEVFGIHCQYKSLCVEDGSQLYKAIKLVQHSSKELEKNWGLVIGEPKIIFCSTDKCKKIFGLSRQAGFNVGTFGIVIAPRGWKKYYVSHELVHFWQATHFGSLVLILGKSWVIEGMAYALSGDPRKQLREPFQAFRSKYLNWQKNILKENLENELKSII